MEMMFKAGSGNRTRIDSLEGYGFTTKLCPLVPCFGHNIVL